VDRCSRPARKRILVDNERTIAGFGSLTIETVGQATLPVVAGSAQLSSKGAIGGYGIFEWIAPGQEASVPLEVRNAGSYILAYDNTNGHSIGIALANVAASAAWITVVISDDYSFRICRPPTWGST
jgi:hypothetical protein